MERKIYALTEVERRGFHVPEEGKVGANVLGDEQVLWEHVVMKFEVHTRNGQTPDTRNSKSQIFCEVQQVVESWLWRWRGSLSKRAFKYCSSWRYLPELIIMRQQQGRMFFEQDSFLKFNLNVTNIEQQSGIYMILRWWSFWWFRTVNAVLYPPQVNPYGIHGMGGELQKFQMESMEWWMESMEW